MGSISCFGPDHLNVRASESYRLYPPDPPQHSAPSALIREVDISNVLLDMPDDAPVNMGGRKTPEGPFHLYGDFIVSVSVLETSLAGDHQGSFLISPILGAIVATPDRA